MKDNKITMSYAKYLRQLKASGVVTAQVSKDTGIRRATFSDWKSGRISPSVQTLYKISKYFGVPIEYFIVEEDAE